MLFSPTSKDAVPPHVGGQDLPRSYLGAKILLFTHKSSANTPGEQPVDKTPAMPYDKLLYLTINTARETRPLEGAHDTPSVNGGSTPPGHLAVYSAAVVPEGRH